MLTRFEIENFCMALERDGCPRPAATLQHFYTLFRERDEQSALIGELRDALASLLPYFEGEHAYDHPDSVRARALLSKLSQQQGSDATGSPQATPRP